MSFKKTVFVFLTIGALLFCSGCSSSYTPPETRLVVDVQYDDIAFHRSDFLIVEQNGLYGAYCRDGEDFRLTIPVEYAQLDAFGLDTTKLVMATAQDGTITALSPQGNVLTQTPISQYASHTEPCDLGIQVSPDGEKWGVLNWDGSWRIQPVYNYIKTYDDGTFLTYQGTYHNLYDPGEIIDWLNSDGDSLIPSEVQVLWVQPEHYGSSPSYLSGEFSINGVEDGNGVLAADGTFLIQPEYDFSIAPKEDDAGHVYFLAQVGTDFDARTDLYDDQGNFIMQRELIVDVMGDGMFRSSGSHTIFTKSGEEISFPSSCDSIAFAGKFAWVKEGDTYRPYDWYGNPIADIRCDRYTILDDDFHQEVAAYRTIDGKIGVVSADGSIFLPAEYEDIMQYYTPDQRALFLKKNGNWGVLGGDGRQMIPFEYERISIASDSGYFLAVKDGKMGILDLQGHIIEDFSYDAPPDPKKLSFSGNYFVVWKENQCGLIAVQ